MNNQLPSLEEIKKSPATPFWVLDLIKVLDTKDCVDAANCLEVLAKVYGARCDAILRGAK